MARIQCLLLFLFVVVLHAAETLVGGPYVVNVGPRSATVCWVVQTSEAKLGAAPDQLDRVAPSLHAERVTYTNLKPGTTYYYDVMNNVDGKGSFQTAPVGRAAFHFVVYGDTRSRHELHRRVVEAIEKTNPEFVLHTGDLVANGNDSGLWPLFFTIEKDLLRKTAFFPALGNHERNSPEFYKFFDVTTPYYSFNWGTAHFIVLDSDIDNVALSADARERFWSEELHWLEQDLQRSQNADLRFVTFHHPPFTAVGRRQRAENREARDLVPLFEKYRVSAVFNGHDHNYQHHLKNGIHYIVTGGGGAPLYPVDAPIPGITLKVERVEHYVNVQVNGNKAHIEARALDGHIIDSFDLN